MEELDNFDMHQEERNWPTLPDDGDIMEPEGDELPDDWDDGDDEGEEWPLDSDDWRDRLDEHEDNSPDNYDDDGDALASAGMGTDEDY